MSAFLFRPGSEKIIEALAAFGRFGNCTVRPFSVSLFLICEECFNGSHEKHQYQSAPRLRRGGDAIEFYKKAFGAEELMRMPGPDGRLMHAAVRIGESDLMMCDAFPEYGGSPSPKSLGNSPVTIHLNTPDVDAVFDRAVKAGATVTMPVADMFWGDRYGKLVDPFGHHWSIATRIENLSVEQMKERGEKAFASPDCS